MTTHYTDRQKRLYNFVKVMHGEQKRKYTLQPYTDHLIAVAYTANKYLGGLATEVGLCHDLFEDTGCTVNDLFNELKTLGYSEQEQDTIFQSVRDLTDRYTAEAYGKLNRANRKRFEAVRLSSICYLSQSIKYADLIDNTGTIVQYDPGFAQVYLAEKKMYLDAMRKGNIDLFIECCAVYSKAVKELGI